MPDDDFSAALHSDVAGPLENPWDVMEAVWYDQRLELLFSPEVPGRTVIRWLDRALQEPGPLKGVPVEFTAPATDEMSSREIWREVLSLDCRDELPEHAWDVVPDDERNGQFSDLADFIQASKAQGWAKSDLWFPHLFKNAEGLKVEHIWKAVAAGVVSSLSEESLWWLMEEADSDMVTRTLSAMQDIVLTGRSRSDQLAASLFFLGLAGKNKDGGDRIWNLPEQIKQISQVRTKLAGPLARHLDPTGGVVGLPFHMLYDMAVLTWVIDKNRPTWKALKEADPSRKN